MCSLIHNSNIFGSCFIHILYTGCAKIKKIIPAPKVKLDVLWMADIINVKHVPCLVACIIGRKGYINLMIFEREIMRKIFGPTRTPMATGGLKLIKK